MAIPGSLARMYAKNAVIPVLASTGCPRLVESGFAVDAAKRSVAERHTNCVGMEAN